MKGAPTPRRSSRCRLLPTRPPSRVVPRMGVGGVTTEAAPAGSLGLGGLPTVVGMPGKSRRRFRGPEELTNVLRTVSTPSINSAGTSPTVTNSSRVCNNRVPEHFPVHPDEGTRQSSGRPHKEGSTGGCRDLLPYFLLKYVSY